MKKGRFYTHNEIKDEFIGKPGTPERNQYEVDLQIDLQLDIISDTIKQLRLQRNLSQEELGKLIGVQKAQISRIEKGNNSTITTLFKIFQALDINPKLCLLNKI